MRDIKFRVWEVEDRIMTSVDTLIFPVAGITWNGPGVGEGWCWLNPDFDWTQKNCNPKPEHIDILMQFTGLCDCNGKEIYEGDIVRYQYNSSRGSEYSWDYNCTVEHDNCNPCFVLVEIGGKDRREYDFIICGLVKLEIIGNKYEHPSLLEPAK